MVAELTSKQMYAAASSQGDDKPEESPTKRLRLQTDELPLIREMVREAQFDALTHACIIVVVDDGFADTS